MRLRVLLLGPNGQLGRDILCAHEEAGNSFDLLPLPRDKLDVAAPGAVERALGSLDFDALVNCAAYTRVDEVEDHAELASAINAHAVRAMAQACGAKGARLVHVSTDYVFGGDVARNRPLREDDPTAPVNVYGASKAMGETLARLAFDDVVILRVASLFGGGRSRRQRRQLRRDHHPRREREGRAPGRRRPDHVSDRHRRCCARRGADAGGPLRARAVSRGQHRLCDLV